MVNGLDQTTNEMGRDEFPVPLELSLMEEAQPGGQIGDDRRCLMNLWRECCRSPRLVVVFRKAGQLVLVIRPGLEVLPDRPGLPLSETVVKPFVVGVIEPLLLQRPFE